MWHLNAGPNSDAGQGHIAGASLASQPVSKQEWSLSIQPDPDLAISCPGSGKISWLAANPCSFICSFSRSVSIKCLLQARCCSRFSEAISEPNTCLPRAYSGSDARAFCEVFLLLKAVFSPGWSCLWHAFPCSGSGIWWHGVAEPGGPLSSLSSFCLAGNIETNHNLPPSHKSRNNILR